MGGFQETKEKVGWTVKLVNLAEDKKEKKEKGIQLVDQLWQCVILEKNTKKDPREFLGKKETRFIK
jgi:hypothetical protein